MIRKKREQDEKKKIFPEEWAVKNIEEMKITILQFTK